jgi:hypothetical protein
MTWKMIVPIKGPLRDDSQLPDSDGWYVEQ